MPIRKRSVFALGLLAVFVGALAVGIVAARWALRPVIGRVEALEASYDGDLIIAAVLEYRQTHRTVPRSLEELIPAHLAEVPKDRSPFGDWSLHPASPGRPVDDEFAMVLDIDHERFRSDYKRVVCYVDVPAQRASWYADPDSFWNTDATWLRTAGPIADMRAKKNVADGT